MSIATPGEPRILRMGDSIPTIARRPRSLRAPERGAIILRFESKRSTPPSMLKPGRRTFGMRTSDIVMSQPARPDRKEARHVAADLSVAGARIAEPGEVGASAIDAPAPELEAALSPMLEAVVGMAGATAGAVRVVAADGVHLEPGIAVGLPAGMGRTGAGAIAFWCSRCEEARNSSRRAFAVSEGGSTVGSGARGWGRAGEGGEVWIAVAVEVVVVGGVVARRDTPSPPARERAG